MIACVNFIRTYYKNIIIVFEFLLHTAYDNNMQIGITKRDKNQKIKIV